MTATSSSGSALPAIAGSRVSASSTAHPSGPDMVDAVVVTYHSRDQIGACIRALRQLRVLGRIVVVEHGGDGAGRVARSLGATVVEDPSNPGFGAGQNRGRSLCTAPYVLLCNPDAVVDPHGLAAGLRAMAADPTLAVCQGVVRDRRSAKPERSGGVRLGPLHLWGRALHLRTLLRARAVHSIVARIPVVADTAMRTTGAPRDVDVLAATAILARRAALDAVGGFDESYFLYGEDLDLCERLRRAGWRLRSIPEHWATHQSGSSASSSWERELYWWEGTMRYAARWYPARWWGPAVGAAAVRAATLALRRPPDAVTAYRRCLARPVRERRAWTRRAQVTTTHS